MIPESIQTYARRRSLSLQDALQTFLQVVTLQHLRHKTAQLIGGTALVLGHGNPRFSEDIDLAGVADPLSLEPSLAAAARDLRGWLASPVSVTPPKKGQSTWVLRVRPDARTHARLHVDSHAYPAYSNMPMVLAFPGLNPTVVRAVTAEEIMADKLVSLAFRNYLGGRDMFDLWFHWLREDSRLEHAARIMPIVADKLRLRRRDQSLWRNRIAQRLSAPELQRAHAEWQRYLPEEFTQPLVLQEIVRRAKELPSLIGAP